jgi:hypothetical protein
MGSNPYLEFIRMLKSIGVDTKKRMPSVLLNILAVKTGKSYLEGVFASPFSFETLGIGKTVYSLKVATKVYGSWDVAKQYIVFMPQDFLAVFDRAIKEGRPVKLIIWDDAGVWIGRMRWLDKYVKTVKEFLNAIRTHCHHIIFTAPSASEIVKGVRDQLNVYTFISSISENPPRSRAAFVFRSVLDDYMKKKVVDGMLVYTFKRYFEFYEEYMAMRKKYVEIGLARMKTALEEVVKEIRGLTDYINDTYRDIAISSEDEDEDEELEDIDFLEHYKERIRMGF